MSLRQARQDIHARSATSDLSTLLQAFQLAPSFGLLLALHVVIVVGPAAVANEEGRAQQRGRGGTDLLHLRDVIGHRSRVVEEVLVEPGHDGVISN